MSLAETISEALVRSPQGRAIQFKGTWRDWDWVRRAGQAVEAALAGAGLGPDDPVGFVPHNRPEFVAALLGLLAGGRHIVMIYAYQSQEAMGRRMAELKLPAVVAGAQDWGPATIGACRANGAFGLALQPDGAPTPVEGLAFRRDAGQARAPSPRGISMLTSGTTGAPKHFTMDYGTIERAMIRESMTGAADGVPDPVLHYFPLGNISGIYGYLPLVVANRPIIMVEKFTLDAWLDYVRTYRPVSCSLPPAGFRMALEAKVPREDLASIKVMPTGAATLDPTVRAEFERVYAPILIVQSYGATEFGGVVTLMTAEDRLKQGPAVADSVGRPWAGAQLRVVDPESGEALPPGREGRLQVLSPRMGPDWITTTDLGMIDADGFIFHRGRLDGAIMRGGFKIVPDVVTAALAAHPAIAAAAVVGVPHERLGQAPVAAFEVRDGMAEPSAADLEAHLRARIPATHVPVRYLRVAALPRTPSLKVDSAGVRALFSEPVA
ncbi:fatty acid--CoA ligase family protein [Phenylobacterium sp.]|jgi:acyl-CoA synthetase (AMP-forming)/AMP-acid ligase II|uniref:class I adenylate-forming enzyme family protein n=1 Tax=Phenylobacterium sp. TaxID=1871053 RepID=UPI002F40E085